MQEIHPNTFCIFSKMVDHFQTLPVIQTLPIRWLLCQNSLLWGHDIRIKIPTLGICVITFKLQWVVRPLRLGIDNLYEAQWCNRH